MARSPRDTRGPRRSTRRPPASGAQHAARLVEALIEIAHADDSSLNVVRARGTDRAQPEPHLETRHGTRTRRPRRPPPRRRRLSLDTRRGDQHRPRLTARSRPRLLLGDSRAPVTRTTRTIAATPPSCPSACSRRGTSARTPSPAASGSSTTSAKRTTSSPTSTSALAPLSKRQHRRAGERGQHQRAGERHRAQARCCRPRAPPGRPRPPRWRKRPLKGILSCP